MNEIKKDPITQLVFVYNADSGMLNLMKDIAHKLFSPKTYPCRLCDLTFSALGERASWIEFRQHLGVAQEYLHIDEFTQQYADQLENGGGVVAYPAVFSLTGEGLLQVLTKRQLDECGSLDMLKQLVLSLLE